MIEIRWTPLASDDLQAVHAFIARDLEFYAGAVVRRIIAALDRLSSFPLSGRVVPEH